MSDTNSPEQKQTKGENEISDKQADTEIYILEAQKHLNNRETTSDQSSEARNEAVDLNILEIDKMLAEGNTPTNSQEASRESESTKRSNENSEDTEVNKRPRVELNDQFDKVIDYRNDHESGEKESGVRSPAPHIDEREELALIANELENATESNKDKKAEKEKDERVSVVHGGVSVPANSELLNTNAALAAYKALSNQFPPLNALSNAHLAALPLPIIAPDILPPRIQLLINSLPTLDNLATQLLRIIAVGPYQKIVDLASNPDTPEGATFRDLTSLFEFTKRLYSEEDPFLTVEHLAPGMWKEGEGTPGMFRNREQSIESTLRKVNLATFLAATLGTIEVGFFYLNESFLDVFCPVNNLEIENSLSNMSSINMSLQSGVNTTIGEKVGKLLKPQAVLYLELKTQAYISAIEAGERSREEILEDILPYNLEEILIARRGSKGLTPTESDFVERCKSRKEILLNHEGNNLSEEYEWFNFIKELFEYVGKNMGYVVWGKRGRSNISHTTPHSHEILNSRSEENNHGKHASINATIGGSPQETHATPASSIHTHSETTPEISKDEQAELKSLTTLLPSEILEQQIHLRINPSNKNLSRRPWTREEEKALRHALELKGPQWSVILELFGNGGKISEALKNRSQVQLKDKARNWKMFFLKGGLPVPEYLQRVTGDLERDEKKSSRQARHEKTAAAPVPSIQPK